MDRTTKRIKRGVDGSTAVRIRYQSPPPRDDDGITTYLASGRNIKHWIPRHTPPDACLAQDQALNKAEALTMAAEESKGTRRDSAVNTDAAVDMKKFEPVSQDDENTQPELSSPKLPFHVPPPRINSKLDERVARAPSSFSTSPGSVATPTITVETASPPQQSDPLTSSPPKSDRRQSSTRSKRSSRAASRDDLEINGNALLDPTKAPDGIQIKLYQDHKGRWYETDTNGRPAWAVHEKTIVKAAPSKRRASTWVKRND